MNKKIIKSFTDLEVYQDSYKASIIVCGKIVHSLPNEENYDLKDQLRRSSKAVPRLIAEGFAKKHQAKSFQKYLDDALGESNETIVSLSHARDIYGKYTNVNLCNQLISTYNKTSKQLYRLGEVWQDFSKRKYPKPLSNS